MGVLLCGAFGGADGGAGVGGIGGGVTTLSLGGGALHLDNRRTVTMAAIAIAETPTTIINKVISP
jgi:hypothetical protein